MTRDERDVAVRPLLDEVCEINQRNGFRGDGRPAADVARAAELWAAIRDVDARFDAANPLPPCPTCGGERLASLDGWCLAFGKCPEAPRALGG